MSFKDITIVITSFKSSEIITNCLNSINSECHVIVVENSSDLLFKKKIENEFNNVECVLTGDNLGYGSANNIGLKKVNTKYALILNPDALLEKNTLENFLIEVKKNKNFAIIGPLDQEKNNKIKINTNNNSSLTQVSNLKGFAMFLNLYEFNDVGFFDENFFLYFEEIDLCKRLSKHGKKIYLSNLIKINHLGGKSHHDSVNDEMELSRNWHWMWSTFYFHKKYNGFIISLIITLPKLISSSVKCLFYTLSLNKKKKKIYFFRFLGLINGILGKSSWYRPKV